MQSISNLHCDSFFTSDFSYCFLLHFDTLSFVDFREDLILKYEDTGRKIVTGLWPRSQGGRPVLDQRKLSRGLYTYGSHGLFKLSRPTDKQRDGQT